MRAGGAGPTTPRAGRAGRAPDRGPRLPRHCRHGLHTSHTRACAHACVHTRASQTPTRRLRGGRRSGPKLVLSGLVGASGKPPCSAGFPFYTTGTRLQEVISVASPPLATKDQEHGHRWGEGRGLGQARAPGLPALSVPREVFQNNLQPTQEPSPASSLHCLTALDRHGHPAGRKRRRDCGAMLGHPIFTTRPAHLQVPSLVASTPGTCPFPESVPAAHASAAPVPGAISPLASWVPFPKMCSNWSNFISRTGPCHTPD